MSNSAQRYLVTVCQYRSCRRSGSDQVLLEFEAHQSDTVMVSGSECQGQCGSGPTVKVMPGNIWYCQVQPEDVAAIAQEHLIAAGKPVQRLLNPRLHPTQETYANLAAQYQAFLQKE